MTIELAHEISLALAEARIAHTIAVGFHDHVPPEMPTEYPGIHARIDVRMPRRHALPMGDRVGLDERLSATIARVEGIGDRFNLDVETGIMDDGSLTFSTRR